MNTSESNLKIRDPKHQTVRRVIAVCILCSLMAAGQSFGPVQAQKEANSDSANITPAPDLSRSVTATITTQGGTIIATASDGTRFTLTIPPAALLGDAEVTMTPVAYVDELPLSGGLVAAVQLEPEGLLLWEPASLTFEPPAPVPLAEEVSFAWHKAGERFHLYPLQIDPSSITMKIVRLGGYGVGRGTDADDPSVAPPDPQDKLEEGIAKIFREERRHWFENPWLSNNRYGLQNTVLGKKKKKKKKWILKICAAQEPNWMESFSYIRALMIAALESKDECLLRDVLNRVLQWERFARIEEVFDDCLKDALSAEHKAVRDFRLKALEILADKAYERCANEHKLEEATRLIRLFIEANRNCGGDDPIFCDLTERIYQKARGCNTFELEFESVIDDPFAYESHVRARVPFQFGFMAPTQATAPLEYYSFRVKVPCIGVAEVKGSTFRIVDVEFDVNVRDGGDCPGASELETPLVSMTIDPGRTSVTLVDCRTGEKYVGDHWSGAFTGFHLDELDESKTAFVIRGWSKGSGTLLARKTYIRTMGPIQEGTALNLFHRPEP
ncbi:MAG TPA: hypothetical protein VLM38_19490 [Blastocatellia bacterium]|nr:hypothetical protein [Blastocatellia bacterium]